jgi:protein-tyrosine phosphatase
LGLFHISIRHNEQIDVDSAGTAFYHIGKSPDSRAIAECSKNRITLTHKARAVTTSDFNQFDCLVAMDNSNYQDLINIAPVHARDKVLLMRNFDSIEKGADVPDPYYGTHKDFKEVFDILYRSCQNMLLKITSE